MAQEPSPADKPAVIPPGALARIPGCEAGLPPQAITALPGGSVNKSFRVDTRAGSFVLRLNDAVGAVLGANHAREVRLHGTAALAGVAPELIHADLAERFMIMRYVPGASWDASDFAHPERLRELGATLFNLHAIAPPAVAPFNLAALLQGHAANLIDALPAERGFLESLMERADAALALCASAGREATIVHNDLCHLNLIQGERLYLIDWEYAAVADPIFDLACVLAYYPQAEPYTRELLEATRLAACVSTAELLRARFLFMLLSFLWYRRRRLAGEVPAADGAAERALLQRLSE
jgi:aminoglycoside phosphotransferase (APT) family kinase protein